MTAERIVVIRLNVLRRLVADTTNAAKTAKPIQTDLQLLALLRKHSAASKAAALEFGAADRDDLKVKEEAQVAVLEEYVAEVDVVNEDDVNAAVENTVAQMRSENLNLTLGAVIKRVMGDGGPLQGKPVQGRLLAQSIKSVLDAQSIGQNNP